MRVKVSVIISLDASSWVSTDEPFAVRAARAHRFVPRRSLSLSAGRYRCQHPYEAKSIE